MAEGIGGLLPPVVLELIAKTDKLKEGLAEARGEISGAADSGSQSMKSLGTAGSAAMLGLAAAAIGVGVAAVHMADEYELAHARLTTVITNTGGTWDEYKGKVEATDKQMEDLGFTNADTEGSLARLTVATKNVQTSTELMGLAADIARARNIDLSSATDLLVKVEQGRYTQLSRLGILSSAQVKDIGSTTDAINILTGIYGGSAAAASETFAGKMEVLKTKVEDLGAQLGMVLIPVIESLVGYLETAIGFLGAANDATNGWLGKLAEFAAIGIGAVMAISAIATGIGKVVAIGAEAVQAISSVSSAVLTFVALNPEIAAIAATVAIVGAAFLEMSQDSDKARLSVDAVGKMLETNFDGAVTSYKSAVDAVNSLTDQGARWKAQQDLNNSAMTEYERLLNESPAVAARYAQAQEAAGLSANVFAQGTDAVAKAHAQANLQVDAFNQKVQDETSAMEGDGTSSADAAAALKDYTQSQKDAAAATKETTDALVGQYDAVSKNTLASLAASTAQIDTKTKLDDYAKSLKDAKLDADGHTKALNDMESQLIETSTKTADAATATQTFGSKTEEAAAKALIQKQYLEQVAGTLAPGSPLRAGLEAYIGTLDGVKSNIDTTINVNTDLATQRIQQWMNQPRTITVGVNTVSTDPTHAVTSRIGAAGGIFKHQTNMIIAETGPEALIPLNDPVRAQQLMSAAGLESSGKGDTHINVNVQTNADPTEIAREIAWAMK